MSDGASGVARQAREDRFVDWRAVAKGGTATVYQVRDTELRCDVAIKILDPKALERVASAEALIESLRNEVKISRRIRHGYICPVHEIHHDSRGLGVIMDFISGVTLRAWMDARKDQLAETTEQRLGLLRKLADALSVAHDGVSRDGGIVHRDLKPENIMLVDGDIAAPVIMDFGCSAFSEQAVDMPGFTPKYMAPEQFSAWMGGPDEVDARADLFAFGIIAYELLTDLVPPTSLKDALLTGAPPSISVGDVVPPSRICRRLPSGLDTAIRLLMEPDPKHRIQSASRLLEVLNSIEPIPAGDLVSETVVETVLVPGGRFRLGSKPYRTTNRNEWPGPIVEMSSFRIDATPVTNAAFRRFLVDAVGVAPSLLDDPGFGRGDHPVVAVTHGRAMEFARWAGGFLPTEAQWERAAKGAGDSAYPWGETFDGPHRANIDTIAAGQATTPVHAFPLGRNSLGLWDMSGNVWEWCADIHDPGFYATLGPESRDPRRDGQTGERVLRGGGFQSFTSQGRCAFRFSAPPDAQRAEIGFRVAYEVSGDV
jgi:formylglycine-generating enzyme required for sulfatase activity/tRNA A-37 threonylcarbamoyl transferase component Bud32